MFTVTLSLSLSLSLSLLSCSKCQHYSPTESNKAFDKAVNRRSGVVFDASSVLEELRREQGSRLPLRTKEEYLRQYVEVRESCFAAEVCEFSMATRCGVSFLSSSN